MLFLYGDKVFNFDFRCLITTLKKIEIFHLDLGCFKSPMKSSAMTSDLRGQGR
jgi:hypothetical protein